MLAGFVGVTQAMVLKKTQDMVRDRMLLICMRCGCLTAYNLEGQTLRKGGEMYNDALREMGELEDGKVYSFKIQRQSWFFGVFLVGFFVCVFFCKELNLLLFLLLCLLRCHSSQALVLHASG